MPSDLDILNQALGDGAAGSGADESPAEETVDEPTEEAPVDASDVADEQPADDPDASKEEEEVDEPADESEQPDETPADKKDEEPEEDPLAETSEFSVKGLQGLFKKSAEFKALVDKNPNIKGFLYSAARRAERGDQYNSMFGNIENAKFVTETANQFYELDRMFKGSTDEDHNNFWSMLYANSWVKGDDGKPVVLGQGAFGPLYKTDGTYEAKVKHLYKAALDGLEGLAGQLGQDEERKVESEELAEAVRIVRERIFGAASAKSDAEKPKLPADVQAKLDRLEQMEASQTRTQASTVESFSKDVETAIETQVRDDIEDLLSKALSARRTAVNEYTRETIAEKAFKAFSAQREGNKGHQMMIRNMIRPGALSDAAKGEILKISKSFAKDLLPRIVGQELTRATAAIVKDSKVKNSKLDAQLKQKEPATKGAVSTPQRGDVWKRRDELTKGAKAQGKKLSDEQLLDGVLGD